MRKLLGWMLGLVGYAVRWRCPHCGHDRIARYCADYAVFEPRTCYECGLDVRHCRLEEGEPLDREIMDDAMRCAIQSMSRSMDQIQESRGGRE